MRVRTGRRSRLPAVALAGLVALAIGCDGDASSRESRRIDELQAELDATKAASADMGDRLSALETSGGQVASELAALRASLEDVSGGVAAVRESLEATRGQQASLGRQLTALDSKLSGEVTQVERSVAVLRDKLDTYIRSHP